MWIRLDWSCFTRSAYLFARKTDGRSGAANARTGSLTGLTTAAILGDVFIRWTTTVRGKWSLGCGLRNHGRKLTRILRVGGVVGENSFKFFVQFVTYACLYCIFCVICTAIYLRKQVVDPTMDWDRQFVALLSLAGFFGAFTGGMSGSSLQFVLYNLTTIENLSKTRRPYTLAVLIPPNYEIPKEGYYPHVTYPLPLPDSSSPSQVESLTDALNDRDTQAQRTFAILQLGIGRNPWDLGYAQNFKEVMGNSFAEWVLPIKRSPLCNHESDESQFGLGRWVEQLLVDVGFMNAKDMRKPKPVSKPYEETPKGIKAAKKARQEGGDVEMPAPKKVGITAEGIPKRAQ